jgi:hypothetical protein
MTTQVCFVLPFLLLLAGMVSNTPIDEEGIWVQASGVDVPQCGSQVLPCKTIQFALDKIGTDFLLVLSNDFEL